ncbi:MAG: pilin [Candidatus Peregrinibacteria bacterium]
MKKLFAKLALFSILSIVAASLNPTATAIEDPYTEETYDPGFTSIEEDEAEVANAATEEAEEAAAEEAAAAKETAADTKLLSNALGDVAGKPCIKNQKENEPDYGYIITIIEEPLSLKGEGSTPGDDYVTRICYRNSFSYKDSNGTVATQSIFAEDCSKSIQHFGDQFGDIQKKYNIKYACDPVQVILSRGGTSLIYGYIGSIYKWGASVAGIIAVLVIIISGIQISAAGGEAQAIDDAKKRIIKSIGGIVVLLLSGLILYTINPTFFTR